MRVAKASRYLFERFSAENRVGGYVYANSKFFARALAEKEGKNQTPKGSHFCVGVVGKSGKGIMGKMIEA